MRGAVALWLVACGGSGPSVDESPARSGPDLAVIGAIGEGDRAILVEDGAIVAVVSPGDPRVTTAVRTVQAERVTAGFVDAHAHPAGLGNSLATLDLVGIDSYRMTLERVRSWKGEGEISGRGWDQNDWPDAPEAGWPLAADLERVAPGRKVVLSRVDGHAMWVSPAVLSEAGIVAETADPPGGRIVRDGQGQPTGVLIDTAMDLVELPAPTSEEAERRLVHALELIASSGLTGVHDMGVDDQTLALYTALDERGELDVRIWAYLTPGTRAAERLLRDGPWHGDHLSVVGIKAYADGALGSRGALLSSPYADEEGHRGLPVTPSAELRSLAVQCLEADAQLAVHAIGDQAVTDVLDGFAAARAAVPTSKTLLRVEHAQIVRPEDRERFAKLSVVASMQPTHATSDMPWAEDRLGPDRIGWAYTWRSLAESGALLAFGSDFPVEGVSPSLGLWAATTRTDARGAPAGGWMPDERLTEAEAIGAFTWGAARAVAEERLGAIEVGMAADLTLWKADRVQPGRLVAEATIVDGEVVWQSTGK